MTLTLYATLRVAASSFRPNILLRKTEAICIERTLLRGLHGRHVRRRSVKAADAGRPSNLRVGYLCCCA